MPVVGGLREILNLSRVVTSFCNPKEPEGIASIVGPSGRWVAVRSCGEHNTMVMYRFLQPLI